MKQIKAELNWGKLAEYLPLDLFNLTNISSFLDQASIDKLNAGIQNTIEDGGSISSGDEELYFGVCKFTQDGDNKYSYHIKTKMGAYIFPLNANICGENIDANIEAHVNGYYELIDTEMVNNKYGTWKSCRIRAVSDHEDPKKTGNVFRDPLLLIVQDYDGSIKFFKGKNCPVKLIAKRSELAKIEEKKSPAGMMSQEREE